MKDLSKKQCRIALVQAEPVMFDKIASLDKALDLIGQAASTDSAQMLRPSQQATRPSSTLPILSENPVY